MISKKIIAAVCTLATQALLFNPVINVSAAETANSTSKSAAEILKADNLKVSTISVSCLKVTWDGQSDRSYTVTCEALDKKNYQ